MIPRRYQRGIAATVVLAAAFYLAIILYSGGWEDFRGALARLPAWSVPAACGLAFGNWLIRFVKWERYRRLLGVRLTRRQSLLIYFSGFALSITPGKMGEAYKSLLIKRIDGTPISRTATIVVAERLTDLLGLLILMAIAGLATVLGGQRLARTESGFDFGRTLGLLAVGTLVFCSLLLVAVLSDRVSNALLRVAGRLPLLRKVRGKLAAFHEASRTLLSPSQIVFPTAISVLSWSCEALALFVLARAFTGDVPGADDAPGAAVTAPLCAFAYCFSMIAGNLAVVLPAGLGVTEGLLGWLLDHSAGLARESAAATTILLRACTLWLAVLVGLVSAALFEKAYGRVDDPPVGEPETQDAPLTAAAPRDGA